MSLLISPQGNIDTMGLGSHGVKMVSKHSLLCNSNTLSSASNTRVFESSWDLGIARWLGECKLGGNSRTRGLWEFLSMSTGGHWCTLSFFLHTSLIFLKKISSSLFLPYYKGQQQQQKEYIFLKKTFFSNLGENVAFSFLLNFFPIITFYWNSTVFYLFAYNFFLIPSLLPPIKDELKHNRTWMLFSVSFHSCCFFS